MFSTRPSSLLAGLLPAIGASYLLINLVKPPAAPTDLDEVSWPITPAGGETLSGVLDQLALTPPTGPVVLLESSERARDLCRSLLPSREPFSPPIPADGQELRSPPPIRATRPLALPPEGEESDVWRWLQGERRAIEDELARMEVEAALPLPPAGSPSPSLRPEPASAPAAGALNAYERGMREHERRRQRKEALSRLYQVELPADGFELATYRAAEEGFPIDVEDGWAAFGGALRFQPEGMSEVVLAAPPPIAREIAEAEEAGRLTLRVRFVPGPDNGTGPCLHDGADRPWRLWIIPLSVEAMEGATPLARWQLPRAAQPAAPPTLTQVEVAILRGEGALPVPTLQGVLEQRLGALNGCCRDRVVRPGALLVQLSLSPQGRVETVRIAMDAVGKSGLSDCLIERLEETVFPVAEQGTEVEVALRLVAAER